METRAHHILIGTFTLLVVGAALLFALWLAKVSVSRQYDFYDIAFNEAVTGLSQGGMVQYNGIKVGDVARLKLDPKDPRRVLVRIRVAADTPVKTDTRAKLGLTGLTGVAFIQLTGGSPQAPLLEPSQPGGVPQIEADESALQKLLSSSENIVTSVNDLIHRAGELLSEENVERISRSLDQIDKITGTVAAEREDIATLISQLSAASSKLNRTLGETRKLVDSANQLLNDDGEKMIADAAAAMHSLQAASADIEALLAENRSRLDQGLDGIAELGPAIHELRATMESLRTISNRIEQDPTGFLLGADRVKEFEPK